MDNKKKKQLFIVLTEISVSLLWMRTNIWGVVFHNVFTRAQADSHYTYC